MLSASSPAEVRTVDSNTCSVPGCDRPKKIRGMCQAHYRRAYRGKPVDTPIRDSSLELVELYGCRVPKHVAASMQAVANERGMSLYEFQREINLEWYRNHVEVKPKK